jgi:hypothetical protein
MAHQIRIFAWNGKRNRLGVLGTDRPGISVCVVPYRVPISSHPEDPWEHSHVSISQFPQLYPVLPAPFLRMLRAAYSKPNLAFLVLVPNGDAKTQEPLENVHVTNKK